MSGNMAGKLYYDLESTSALLTLKRLEAAARHRKIGKSTGELREWLGTQDAYTLHRPVRKNLPSNPYSVNNQMDVWECDLVDIQGPSKHDGINYLLSFIDVFSK